ncbi:MAG TPA: nodulation protein NfeD [Bryobacteraceae bacterium]|jgi:membrane-bound serine protease (ClpP class)|nr:nodulation protein NfeD [Bryobacteraceae bacterium]
MSTRAMVLVFAAAQLFAAPKIIAVNVDGMIHPVTAEIIKHAISEAERENAAAVLLRLNTPGGLLDASREITSAMIASRAPVIAYVTPGGGRAASAGFFLLETADVAAMSSGTNTGAASPVLLEGQMDDVMRKKVENDTSAWLRSIVLKRGRNVDEAEKAVRDAKSWTDKEALNDHLVDLIEPDEAALIAALDGRRITRFDGRTETLRTAGTQVVNYSETARERIIGAVADPNLAFILLVLGALGIYVEFSSPGLILPGIAGAILVLLGLSGLAVLPINWIGAALLILAMVLFALEAKFASHGILGAGGTVSMILGALLLINGPPEVRIHLSTALAVTLPFAAVTMFLVTLVVRARRSKALLADGGVLDEIGQARTALDPAGKVFVHGEYWDALSDQPVQAGAEVRVIARDGMKLKVEPAKKN